MRWRVGSVPYVNAAPLVWSLPSHEVEVVMAVPSALPELLRAGDVQAILVSSVFALMNSGLQMADGIGIASHRKVTSVKVFSRLPLRDVQTLAFDASSMTSNRLALEILRYHGSHPATISRPPNLAEMLSEADACVLIGDIGMSSHLDGVIEYDLGDEWRALTGLPFLWAGWVGNDIPAELVSAMHAALREAQLPEAVPLVVAWSSAQSGLPPETVDTYLQDIMSYQVTDSVKAGYREYARRIDAPFFPEFVGPGLQSN